MEPDISIDQFIAARELEEARGGMSDAQWDAVRAWPELRIAMRQLGFVLGSALPVVCTEVERHAAKWADHPDYGSWKSDQ